MKKFSLRFGMLLNIVFTIVMLLVYWNRESELPLAARISIYSFVVIFCVFCAYYNKRKDVSDELAVINLKRADSICLRMTYVVSILVVIFFPLVVSDFSRVDISWSVAGFVILICILASQIFRGVIFLILEKKGDIEVFKWLY